MRASANRSDNWHEKEGDRWRDISETEFVGPDRSDGMWAIRERGEPRLLVPLIEIGNKGRAVRKMMMVPF